MYLHTSQSNMTMIHQWLTKKNGRLCENRKWQPGDGGHGPLCVPEKQNQKSLQRERSFLEMCLDAWNPQSLRGALVMLELRVRKPADCKTRQKLLPNNCIKTLNRIHLRFASSSGSSVSNSGLYQENRGTTKTPAITASSHLPQGKVESIQINSTLPSETAAGATSTPSRSQSWQVDRKKGIQTDPNSTRTSEESFRKPPEWPKACIKNQETSEICSGKIR